MNKIRIIFPLFFIHLYAYGMDSEDILSCITIKLCSENSYKIKNNIKNLTLTNKFFCNYYASEKIKQNIIRTCALFNNSNDYDIANVLGYYKIKEKIEYFVTIAKNSSLNFEEEDLKETWYLNVTTYIKQRALPCNQSLLYIALDHAYDTNICNLEKVKSIIHSSLSLNFFYGEGQNILSRISFFRYYIMQHISPESSLLQDLLEIARDVLDKGMLPDGHTKRSQHTPLMLAAMNKDISFVRLLLEYDANPYAKTYQQMVGAPEQCAFDMHATAHKKWLTELVNEVKTKKIFKTR